MEIDQHIVIVGAGVAGLATSLGLHRLGLRSLVLESSDSLRTTGFGLTLWINAWRALDALGVGNHLRERSLQLQGFQLLRWIQASQLLSFRLQKNSELYRSAVWLAPSICAEFTFENHEGRCVKRKELLETLKKELPEGTIRFAARVVSIEESGPLKVLQLADGCLIRTKVLIGCDGVNSMVARCLGLQKPIDTGRSAIRGFVDYPEGHQLKPKIHACLGGGVRFGFIPCDDKSLYWFCTINPSVSSWHEDMAQDPVKLKEFVLSIRANIPNIPQQVSDFLERTTLDSISCAALKLRLPWDILMSNIAKRGICVAGDALHPMTPDIGQGGCSALEDSVILAKCIGESFLKRPKRIRNDGEKDDEEIAATLNKGVEEFAKVRKWRSFSLVATAYLVGFIQESNNRIICFLREKFLSKHTIATMLRMADFDCGKLSSHLVSD